MIKPKRQILIGTDLSQALKAMRPDHILKMMIEEKVFSITVKMAVFIVRVSPYEGEFRHGRVFKIRAIDIRTSNKHDHNFRDGRSCMQFTPITRKTIEVWDKSTSRSHLVKVP